MYLSKSDMLLRVLLESSLPRILTLVSNPGTVCDAVERFLLIITVDRCSSCAVMPFMHILRMLFA